MRLYRLFSHRYSMRKSDSLVESITTLVTYLERRGGAGAASLASLEGERRAARGARLAHIHKIPLHFYRYLYDVIGSPHHWVSRRGMSDETLRAILHDPMVEVHLLYVNDLPAGYFELDFMPKDKIPPLRLKEKRADIAFLGLTPEYLGRGLGKFLMRSALRRIETHPKHRASRITIQTCTLDHPRALPLYRSFGFAPYAQREEIITVLD